MSSDLPGLSDRLRDYIRRTGFREAPALRALRDATSALPAAMMQISPEQGALMQLLVRLIGARRSLEVGTFPGYSALAVALALPADGQDTACDVSEEWTAIARQHWQQAGVAGKITLKLAPALQTLDALLAAGGAGTYDFAFIDADKSNYDGYYEHALKLVRPGGLIAIDNVLWSGAVADPAKNSDDTKAIRALNAKLYADPRVEIALLPMADGLTLARPN